MYNIYISVPNISYLYHTRTHTPIRVYACILYMPQMHFINPVTQFINLFKRMFMLHIDFTMEYCFRVFKKMRKVNILTFNYALDI